MTVFQGSAFGPSGDASALADVISLFGAIGDYALEHKPGYHQRVAALAADISQLAGVPSQDQDAVYIAGVMHAVGALGNGGLRKTDALPPRAAMMERWNIPAAGARICERIAALPKDTADIIRWHAENWDGTGYPDQLRWHGIPRCSQYLHIAEAFELTEDPEEALTKLGAQAGRKFSPEDVRTFVMWFHTTGGEIEARQFPLDALDAQKTSVDDVLRIIGEAIDAHNGTPHRGERIAQRAAAVAKALAASERDIGLTSAAARLFGIGEMKLEDLEYHQFDPLAGLGRELRAQNAANSAGVLEGNATFADIVHILAARAEWFDGTGLPKHLRGDQIPLPARILAACIAHDALDEMYRTQIRSDRAIPMDRIEQAAGTQFDPAVVRALADAVKAAPV